jgi:hypothetical protein
MAHKRPIAAITNTRAKILDIQALPVSFAAAFVSPPETRGVSRRFIRSHRRRDELQPPGAQVWTENGVARDIAAPYAPGSSPTSLAAAAAPSPAMISRRSITNPGCTPKTEQQQRSNYF